MTERKCTSVALWAPALAGLVFLLAAAALAAQALFDKNVEELRRERVVNVTPAELADLRSRQQSGLHADHSVIERGPDGAPRRIHIPIDAAMELVVTELGGR